jgi:hypothetical protein
VDIITGRYDKYPDNDSLLLFRVYDFKTKVENEGNKWPSDNKLQAFYKLCLNKLCKRGGWEAKRPGGSSGRPRYDAEFFRFIKRPGSFPRKGRGVKFVKYGRQWLCGYIRVKARARRFPGVSFSYSAPRRGGQFNVAEDVLNRFPFLVDFAEIKIYAALVLNSLNQQESSVPVQKSAVAYELGVLQMCAAEATTELVLKGTDELPPKQIRKERRSWADNHRKRFRRMVIEKFTSHNQHTLVQHPVGFHRDIFRDGKECLENKICFVLDGQHVSDPMGRGGRGHDKFVVVFLDWAN